MEDKQLTGESWMDVAPRSRIKQVVFLGSSKTFDNCSPYRLLLKSMNLSHTVALLNFGFSVNNVSLECFGVRAFLVENHSILSTNRCCLRSTTEINRQSFSHTVSPSLTFENVVSSNQRWAKRFSRRISMYHIYIYIKYGVENKHVIGTEEEGKHNRGENSKP